jgi:hypothetical protein
MLTASSLGGSSFILASQDESATNFFTKFSSPNFNDTGQRALLIQSGQTSAKQAGSRQAGDDQSVM